MAGTHFGEFDLSRSRLAGYIINEIHLKGPTVMRRLFLSAACVLSMAAGLVSWGVAFAQTPQPTPVNAESSASSIETTFISGLVLASITILGMGVIIVAARRRNRKT